MRKKLHILTKERADLARQGRELVELIDADGREATAEEQTTLDDLKVKVVEYDVDIDKAITVAEASEPFAARDDGQGYSVPATAIDREEEARGGFRDLGEYAKAVHNAMNPQIAVRDDRLNAAVHQETGTGESFMVPAAMSTSIWEVVQAESEFLGRTMSEVTAGNQVSKPTDDSTPWGTTGMQAYWRGENAQMTESNLHTETADVKLNELYSFATATDELLEDAPLLTSRLQRGAVRAINWKVDEAIFRGDGAGKFRGILNADALVTVAKETSQTADTVVAANVLKMYSRMLAGSINNAVWVANTDTFPSLASMTIGNQPMYMPPGNMVSAPHGTLMGRPIVYSEHADTVGDVGDLVFADFGQYYTVRKASGVKFDQSMHLYFDYNKQAFRWVIRLGGQPLLDTAITPPNSANTKGHFIALAARA